MSHRAVSEPRLRHEKLRHADRCPLEPRSRSRLRTPLAIFALLALLCLVPAASAATFSNPAPITIESCCGGVNVALPYPSTIPVSGLTGTVTKVTATLSAFGHGTPNDVDVLLVGPGGQSVILMSDAGGAQVTSFNTLTFDDGAPDVVPPGSIASGTYRPTNHPPDCGSQPNPDVEPEPDIFAPPPPYGSALSVFDGTDPNGTWSLYVVDDCWMDLGKIEGGWSVTVTTSGSPATTFSNTSPITIPDVPVDMPATGSPYPSAIPVSGLNGGIVKVTVTLNAFSHSFPDDVDILLVAPNGVRVLLLSDAGGRLVAASGATLTFDDAALLPVPDIGPIVSGTYRPSNYGPQCSAEQADDPFPALTPLFGHTFNTTLATFNGANPNGTWRLYAVDDCLQGSGTISGGWTLDITAGGTTAIGVRRLSASAAKGRVVVRWSTAQETDVAGFILVRSGGGARTKVNRALIPAKAGGRAAGASYRVVDRRVRRGVRYTYRLQAVSLAGKRSWAGVARVAAR